MIKVIAFDLGGTLLREKINFSEESKFLVPLFDDDKYYNLAIKHFRATKRLVDKIVDEVIEETFELRDRNVFTSFSGFDLAIASNFTSRMRNFLEEQNVLQYFKTVVISAEIGVNKPDPKFFKILAKKIGEEPKNILFVDNLQVNVDAAEKLGFKILKYNEGEDLVKVVQGKLKKLSSREN